MTKHEKILKKLEPQKLKEYLDNCMNIDMIDSIRNKFVPMSDAERRKKFPKLEGYYR